MKKGLVEVLVFLVVGLVVAETFVLLKILINNY